MFLKRSLEYSQFTNRCSSVSPKKSTKLETIKHRWYLSCAKLFEEEDVDVVLSADKFFLRFHETTRKVLAPKGVKRVGVALSVNEKNAFFVIITLDIFVNIVLPPFIIFTGVLVLY